MNTSTNIERLPVEIARQRIFSPAESAQFCSVSLPQWRVMSRKGQTPKPVRLSQRKIGWRVGDLCDWIEAHAKSPEA